MIKFNPGDKATWGAHECVILGTFEFVRGEIWCAVRFPDRDIPITVRESNLSPVAPAPVKREKVAVWYSILNGRAYRIRCEMMWGRSEFDAAYDGCARFVFDPDQIGRDRRELAELRERVKSWDALSSAHAPPAMSPWSRWLAEHDRWVSYCRGKMHYPEAHVPSSTPIQDAVQELREASGGAFDRPTDDD